ncbi:MAG: winged helix-turn-helix transcriptional regulator, partial [SAR324 cluster bacterium]|nr:winged helix-turn-helix transcriptional regulator [SAR324 cluster bacterium]
MNQTTSTRDRVLEFIKKEGSVSVKTLTLEIGITPMAIRGHLTKLEKEELIEVQNVRQKLGRPLQVFALTSKGENSFPKSYDTFALDLIADIKSLDGGETFKKIISKREERLEEHLKE